MTRFWRATRGALTVEFALISFLFVAALGMALEVARVQIASMLLERSVYDMAHQIRVNRGADYVDIVDSVIAARSNGLFRAQEVTVELTSGYRAEDAVSGANSGSGGPGDVVRLRLTAALNIFGGLVPSPLVAERTITYYFRNEPEFEAEI
jgi:hypothetical protein